MCKLSNSCSRCCDPNPHDTVNEKLSEAGSQVKVKELHKNGKRGTNYATVIAVMNGTRCPRTCKICSKKI